MYVSDSYVLVTIGLNCHMHVTFNILKGYSVTDHSGLQNSNPLHSQLSLSVKSQVQQKVRILDKWVLRYMDWLSSFWYWPLYCLSKFPKIIKLFSLSFKRYLEQDPSKNLIFSVQFRTQSNNIHIFSISAITLELDHLKSWFLFWTNSINQLYPSP